MSSTRSMAMLAAICLVVGATASPVRRSPDLEARRRSAIDRSMIRFGRSYPPEPSAADLREIFQRPSRHGNSFLRFGRSEPLFLTADDLLQLLSSYDEDYEIPVSKKSPSFVRFGRGPSFVRFGRSGEEEKIGNEQNAETDGTFPQRKLRARNHFIRLGRDSEAINNDLGLEEEDDSRMERATEICQDCA